MRAAETQTTEPFGLSRAALERIADDAGVEDADCVRRILRAYWFSKERVARDAALACGRRHTS